MQSTHAKSGAEQTGMAIRVLVASVKLKPGCYRRLVEPRGFGMTLGESSVTETSGDSSIPDSEGIQTSMFPRGTFL
jgi:hypothetical protein